SIVRPHLGRFEAEAVTIEFPQPLVFPTCQCDAQLQNRVLFLRHTNFLLYGPAPPAASACWAAAHRWVGQASSCGSLPRRAIQSSQIPNARTASPRNMNIMENRLGWNNTRTRPTEPRATDPVPRSPATARISRVRNVGPLSIWRGSRPAAARLSISLIAARASVSRTDPRAVTRRNTGTSSGIPITARTASPLLTRSALGELSSSCAAARYVSDAP